MNLFQRYLDINELSKLYDWYKRPAFELYGIFLNIIKQYHFQCNVIWKGNRLKLSSKKSGAYMFIVVALSYIIVSKHACIFYLFILSSSKIMALVYIYMFMYIETCLGQKCRS